MSAPKFTSVPVSSRDNAIGTGDVLPSTINGTHSSIWSRSSVISIFWNKIFSFKAFTASFTLSFSEIACTHLRNLLESSILSLYASNSNEVSSQREEILVYFFKISKESSHSFLLSLYLESASSRLLLVFIIIIELSPKFKGTYS